MILECKKGHTWNTSFDISYSHLMPGDSCPLPIKYNKRETPSVILCGLLLSQVTSSVSKKKEKPQRKFQPKKRMSVPYHRSRTKKEGRRNE